MVKALTQPLTPSKAKLCKLKEWTSKMKGGKLKQWERKMKEWTMITYLLSEKYIAYGILPPSTTMTEHPIIFTWDGATWFLVTVPSTISSMPISTSSIPLPPLLNPPHQRTSLQMRSSWLNKVSNKDSKILDQHLILKCENNCYSFMTIYLLR